jgi:hypothetical protein
MPRRGWADRGVGASRPPRPLRRLHRRHVQGRAGLGRGPRGAAAGAPDGSAGGAAMLLPVFIVSDMVGVWLFRRDFDSRNLAILIPASLLGVLIATLLAPGAAGRGVPDRHRPDRAGLLCALLARPRTEPAAAPGRPAARCLLGDHDGGDELHLPFREPAVPDLRAAAETAQAGLRRDHDDHLRGGEPLEGAGLLGGRALRAYRPRGSADPDGGGRGRDLRRQPPDEAAARAHLCRRDRGGAPAPCRSASSGKARRRFGRCRPGLKRGSPLRTTALATSTSRTSAGPWDGASLPPSLALYPGRGSAHADTRRLRHQSASPRGRAGACPAPFGLDSGLGQPLNRSAVPGSSPAYGGHGRHSKPP